MDDEIELDLESLGLTDKEIKPEKIQKLEKIGSGGFKEYVYFLYCHFACAQKFDMAVSSSENIWGERLLSQSFEGSSVLVSRTAESGHTHGSLT